MDIDFLACSGYLTKARARALLDRAASENNAGYKRVLRSLGGNEPLSPQERAEVEAEGVQIVGARQARAVHFVRDAGRTDGERAAVQALAGGLRAQDAFGVDLEGGDGEDYVGYLRAWLAEAHPALVEMGLAIKVYLGLGAAQAFTGPDLDAVAGDFPGVEYWTPYPDLVPTGALPSPSAGWWASQYRDGVVIGDGEAAQSYDLNCASLAANATAHPGHDILRAMGTDERFTFARKAGESVGDRHARCWEEALSEGPMGHASRDGNTQRYESFVDATKPAGYMAGHAVDSIAAWSTSCLITQEASLHWCGWRHGPPVCGQGFYAVLGWPSAQRFVSFSGHNRPDRGDILYWANSGYDGHVECFRGIAPDGVTWLTAGGGGGSDGTACSLREHRNGADQYGRRLIGWWSISAFGLPLSPA